MTKYFTQLNALTSLASGDAFAVEDISAGETKYITRDNLAADVAGSFSIVSSGRLTTESGVPFSTSDRSAQTSIYLTPYNGRWMPVYDGASMVAETFSQLTLSLNSTPHVSGNVYDIFFWSDSGTMRIGTGPAWSSTTSRGTGAGTTELTTQNGIYCNANSITLKNGASTYAGIATNYATYVGSFYCATTGQVYDTLYYRHLWNMNNRGARMMNTTYSASHTYVTGSWRAWNSNTSGGGGRISFISGLTSTINISLLSIYTSVASGFNYNGLGYDSTAAANIYGTLTVSGTSQVAISIPLSVAVGIGYHYINALEYGSATSHTMTDANMSGRWEC